MTTAQVTRSDVHRINHVLHLLDGFWTSLSRVCVCVEHAEKLFYETVTEEAVFQIGKSRKCHPVFIYDSPIHEQTSYIQCISDSEVHDALTTRHRTHLTRGGRRVVAIFNSECSVGPKKLDYFPVTGYVYPPSRTHVS